MVITIASTRPRTTDAVTAERVGPLAIDRIIARSPATSPSVAYRASASAW